MSAAEQPTFDAYQGRYREAVQDSIAFSGIGYDYFLRSKAALLTDIAAARLPADLRPKVLDVGCGVGALHPLLLPMCRELHGVDVSAACLERAAEDNPSAGYRAYDGDRLPFEDAGFDLTFAACVMHHVDPQAWGEFAAEMRRVTRPGGLVCVIEHNPLNPATRLSVMRCPFDEEAVLLRRRRTAELFQAAGLTQVDWRYFVFVPSMQPWAQALERRLAGCPLGAQYAVFGQA